MFLFKASGVDRGEGGENDRALQIFCYVPWHTTFVCFSR